MGMTSDDLKKECKYICLEIDNSGLEGFRCRNRNIIKKTGSSWCDPKNGGEPCSICEYCEPKREDMEMTIDEKQTLADLLSKLPIQVLQLAYLYAVNMTKYGVDVTKEWETVIQNSNALERAYQKGYYEGLKQVNEWENEKNE